MTPRLLAILGPTGCGKSAVAMALARQLPAEIISCDSMQVYRGLDLGTAKPTPAEQAAVPHHLVDTCEITEPYDVKRFLHAAQAAWQDILARGRWPILCGGTGLYARALLYGYELRPTDPAVRAAVAAELATRGAPALLAELASADPVTAAQVTGNDRRLIRAVEVLRLTAAAPGARPAPAQRIAVPTLPFTQFVLLPDLELGRARIATRTAAMLAAGWVDEARALLAAGLLHTPTASQALGYATIGQFLATATPGAPPDHAALATALVTETCRYAKRQRTWFRHQHPGAQVLALGAADTPEAVAARLLAQLTAPAPEARHG